MQKVTEFIENHRVLTWILIIIVIFFLILCVLRGINKSKKSKNQVEENPSATAQVMATPEPEIIEDTPTPEPKQDYESDLSIDSKAKKKQEKEEIARAFRIEEEERKKAEEKRIKEAIKKKKPTFGDEVICWDSDGVPETMVDGSSLKAFYKESSLSDFGSYWGSKLSQKDKITKKLYLVGVDQNPNDTKSGYDCQSLGWLIQNLNRLDRNACIKFTDLNTIGSLAKDHVALLCNYDWYSAFGLKDTMVVFEDISGTLNKSNFKSGTIFSAYTYVHNIKVKVVHGEHVICIQYNKF